jgi:hypothetical protein
VSQALLCAIHHQHPKSNNIVRKINIKDLAGIEYHGTAGITSHCVDAITNMINCGIHIAEAKLLTCNTEHAFLIKTIYERYIAIKSGFASGYGGEAPKGLSYSLCVLEKFADDIYEYNVSKEFLERLDNSCLTEQDVLSIEISRPLPGCGYFDYVFSQHTEKLGFELSRFTKTVPFGLVDYRLADLAKKFDENPDNALLVGYRRLEDIVRKKSALHDDHSSKLFSKAFQGEASPLFWEIDNAGEIQGRIQLFTGAYLAFRNSRAHKEISHSYEQCVDEFMLLNTLYKLELKSKKRVNQALNKPIHTTDFGSA